MFIVTTGPRERASSRGRDHLPKEDVFRRNRSSTGRCLPQEVIFIRKARPHEDVIFHRKRSSSCHVQKNLRNVFKTQKEKTSPVNWEVFQRTLILNCLIGNVNC
jgi:hypothetical protein